MTAQKPLVSVLMPVYNADRWLEAALASVFAETVDDFEVVAVDDGSTDASPRILDEWSARDSRLRVVRADHGGLPRAREISLREARGAYAAFLDADDLWLPHRLEHQLPHADPATVVFGGAYLMNEAGETIGAYSTHVVAPPDVEWPADGLFSELLELGSFIPILTVLAPVRLLVDAGSFTAAERAGFGSTGGQCDYEMWLTLALRGARFHYVDEPLARYRVRGDSLSADTVQSAVEGLRLFRFLESRERGEVSRRLRLARIRMQGDVEVAYRKQAWRLLLVGDRPGARRDLLSSLRSRPASARAWLALILVLCAPPLARRAARRGSAGA